MKSMVILCIMAFLGGIFSDQVLRPAAVTVAESTSSGVVNFVDRQNRLRLDVGMYKDRGMENFYGPDGKLRLQLGTYTDEIRASEEGLPCVTLYDNSGNLKLVIRLDGPNQGPLIIMKDRTGTNRLIMGLDIWDPGEEPFLVTWDKQGKQKDVFGHFEMKPL